MPARSKPGVDWTEIERRYKSGETPYDIAKTYPVKITRQSIMERAQRHGWDGNGPAVAAQVPVPQKRTTTLPALTRDTRSAKARELVIDAVMKGGPLRLAAKRAALSDEFLKVWVSDDPGFRQDVERAKAECVLRKIERVDEAGERGDVKADFWFLERDLETRDEFGQAATRGNGGVNIQVVLNIPRAEMPEAITVEHTAVPVSDLS